MRTDEHSPIGSLHEDKAEIRRLKRLVHGVAEELRMYADTAAGRSYVPSETLASLAERLERKAGA